LSNSDSFIDEVTEELRRDRLFAAFRRYGWIGIGLIVLMVGWVSWTEFSRNRTEAAAQAFGDAVTAALAIEDTDQRTAALDAIEADDPEQRALLTFLKAAEPGAGQALEGLATSGDLPAMWRDVAEFKRLVTATEIPVTERRARFEALTRPGAGLRLLAEEQIALIEAGEGESAAAIERLNRLTADSEATADLRRRAAQLIVALGGTPGS
jgi:hypothetical protein